MEKLRKLRKNWESWGKNKKVMGQKNEKFEEKLRMLRKNWESSGKTEKTGSVLKCVLKCEERP